MEGRLSRIFSQCSETLRRHKGQVFQASPQTAVSQMNTLRPRNGSCPALSLSTTEM